MERTGTVKISMGIKYLKNSGILTIFTKVLEFSVHRGNIRLKFNLYGLASGSKCQDFLIFIFLFSLFINSQGYDFLYGWFAL